MKTPGTIKLTDREKSALGYDETGILDAEPLRRAIVRKVGSKPIALTADEWEQLRWDVSQLDNTGCDAGHARTVTRLQNKVADES